MAHARRKSTKHERIYDVIASINFVVLAGDDVDLPGRLKLFPATLTATPECGQHMKLLAVAQFQIVPCMEKCYQIG